MQASVYDSLFLSAGRFFKWLLCSGLVASIAYVGKLPAREVEDVLVTASRIPEPGISLPLSYSSVSNDEINLVAAVHPNEIMQRIPAAWISRGNGQESLVALRSQVFTGAGGCGSILMAADGISLRAPGFCNVNQLFYAHSEQADRIEVIQGPASAIFGTNAMHGVINVLSGLPAPQNNYSSLTLSAGPHDYQRVALQGAIGRDKDSFDLRFTGTSDGGYLDESGYDQQKLTLSHSFVGDEWQVASVFEATNLNQETAGFIEGFNAYKDDAVRKSNPNPEAYRDTWSLRAHTRLTRQLSESQSFQLTPYLRRNSMEFLQHFLPWQAVEKNGHESVGFQSLYRLQYDNLEIKTGLDFDFTEGWLKENQPEPFGSPNFPQGIHYDFRVTALGSGLFSQLDWRAADRWLVSAGVRYEYTGYDYRNRTEDGSPCTPAAKETCRFFRPADRRDHFNSWSSNLGLSYEYNTAQYVFARIAKGFRAPETNELYRLQAGQQVADLDTESLLNYELGARGELGSNFRYRLAFFHMDKNDVIFQNANRQNVTGAETRHRGVEVALDYAMTEHWYVGASFSFARHQYASNAPLLFVSSDIANNDIDTAPRHFGSARLGYNAAVLHAELEWVHMGKYYLEPENRFSYTGHDLFNFRINKKFSPLVSAAVRVTNLFNQRYAERADYAFGDYRYFVGESRAAFVDLRLSLAGE